MFDLQLAGLIWQQTCSVNDTKDFNDAFLSLDQMLNLFFEFGFFHTNYLINWFIMVLSQVDARITTDKMNELMPAGFILTE